MPILHKRVYAHTAQEASAQELPYPRERVRSSVIALTYSYFRGFSGNYRQPPTPSLLLKSRWHPPSKNCPHQNWALGSCSVQEQKMEEIPSFSAIGRLPVARHWTVRKAEEKVGIFSLCLLSSSLTFWPLLGTTTQVWMLTCLFLLLQVPIELEGIVGVNRTAPQEIPGFFNLLSQQRGKHCSPSPFLLVLPSA